VFELVTVIADVVAPVLHDKVPPAVVDNIELPQLLLADIVGVVGTDRGDAVAVPYGLVHPLRVCVTE
jgi:hypothetical protein